MKRTQRILNIRGRAQMNGRPIGRYQSKLERSAIVAWLLNPDVASTRLNSHTITYVDADGKKRRYTPDLVIEWKSSVRRRPLAIEMKYAAELATDLSLEKKHALLTIVFSRLGYDFVVHTEEDVFTPDFPAKAFILGHLNDPSCARESEILGRVCDAGCISLGELLSSLSDNERERLCLVPAIWRLVAHRRIFIDYSGPIGDATLLWSAPLAERR